MSINKTTSLEDRVQLEGTAIIESTPSTQNTTFIEKTASDDNPTSTDKPIPDQEAPTVDDTMPVGNATSIEMAATAESIVTFTLFPKLAPELQRIIWKLAVPAPRIIQVRVGRSRAAGEPLISFGPDNPEWDPLGLTFRSDSILSPLFQACRTSREVIMETHGSSIPLEKDQRLFFDSERDTIFLVHEDETVLVLNTMLITGEALESMHSEEGQICAMEDLPHPWHQLPTYHRRFSEVKNLALPWSQLLCRPSEVMSELVPALSSLEKLVLVECPPLDISKKYEANQNEFRFENLEDAGAAFVSSVRRWKARLSREQDKLQELFDAFEEYKASHPSWQAPEVKSTFTVMKTNNERDDLFWGW